jgi:hypothetical protein
MITLPSLPRRAWLISFWLVISSAIGLLLGVPLSILLNPRLGGLGMGIAAGLALLGVIWPRQIVTAPYEGWNRLTRYFTRRARLLLLGLCFYVTFVAVGRFGSLVLLKRLNHAESLWTPSNGSIPSEEFRAGSSEKRLTGHWCRDYCSWALRSGNEWAVCLLPFLFFLRILNTVEAKHEVPVNAYTLF